MRLITARTVEQYAQTHMHAAQAISDWCAMVEAARWRNGDDVRRSVGSSARPIADRRIVFGINHNDYRIVCDVQYADPEQGLNGILRVQFIGSHAEYDRVDALTVTLSPSAPRAP